MAATSKAPMAAMAIRSAKAPMAASSTGALVGAGSVVVVIMSSRVGSCPEDASPDLASSGQDPTLEDMMTTTTDPAPTSAPVDEAAIGAFAERIAMAAIGAFEVAAIELGMRLGLYAALAEGPATPPELAQRSAIDGRYSR